ncbi:GntR family transcriptional regulator [Hydrogenophaga intermedia]|uniref:GntR family transcriptional regulator n=1 Tax=Hydrogenophaga intermedia TaxID=65786 RepID=UPI00204332E8|nr:GntR family transcriptional regulator [Hydrogenophaga intermedia]MCM3562831.1 GntR family transcriptional regulator [Hydrogenophaga intermedia]
MARSLRHLKAKIISGELSPGEQIRQEEMAEQIKVSRVPLREALNVLTDQQLLVHRPHQGYFVSKRAPHEHAQIRRMLSLLEDELMSTIAWPDPETLAALSGLNSRMSISARSADIESLVELNREFHFRIFSLSPHNLILQEVRRLWSMAEPAIWSKFQHPEHRERTLVEHDALLDALASRERKRCIAELERHRNSVAAGGFPWPAPARKRTRW